MQNVEPETHVPTHHALVVLLAPGTAAAGAPEEKVAAYHQALLVGDIEAAKGMLAEDLLLFKDDNFAKSHQRAPRGAPRSMNSRAWERRPDQ